MNKPELVTALASLVGISKAEAARVVDGLFGAEGIIAGELKRGRRVMLSGFGNFEPRRRQARTVRNPKTGRAMAVKASVAPVFRAAKGLKATVNRR